MRLTLATLLVAITLLVAMAVPAASQPGAWQEAAAFLALFAPAGQRAQSYRAYVTPLDLDAVLETLADDVSLVRTPGAWQPHALLPLDAFGQTGSYDRWAIVRLYRASRPRVARGARRENGQITESWTLISPYPDTTLQRLEPGTLLIVLRLGS